MVLLIITIRASTYWDTNDITNHLVRYSGFPQRSVSVVLEVGDLNVSCASLYARPDVCWPSNSFPPLAIFSNSGRGCRGTAEAVDWNLLG